MRNVEPIIRTFREGDADAVVALSLRAWEPVFESLERVLGPSGIFPLLQPDWRTSQERTVRDACGAEGMQVWVAEVDAGVAGFATGRLDRETNMGEVYLIAVDPAYQGKGIGTRLMSVALTWFEDNGMRVAMVETGGDPGHAPARRVYERTGFTQLPVVRYFRTL